MMKIFVWSQKMKISMTSLQLLLRWKNEQLGMFLKTWVKYSINLWKFPTGCKITEKRVNRGVGYDLEIPVQYRFTSDKKAVDWAEKNIKKALKV